jgi:O-antigen ligase
MELRMAFRAINLHNYLLTKKIIALLILLAVLSGFLLARFSPLPVVGSIIFFALILPLSWFSPQGAFLLFLALLITDQTIEIATIDFWLAELVCIPIILFWLIRTLLTKSSIPKVSFSLPIALFMVVTLANVAYTTDITAGLGMFRKELGAILLCFALVSMKLSLKPISRIVNALILVCVVSCIVGIMQNLTGSFGFTGQTTERGYLSLIMTRQLSWVRNANGFFKHFNTFGSFTAQITPLCLSLALYSTGYRRRWYFALLLVIASGLLLSYSRGALLAALAASLVVWYPKVKIRLWDKLMFFAISGMAIYIASSIFFRTDYLTITNRLAPRVRIWGVVLENIRQHFWAGTGLASMMDIIEASVRSGPIIASHNNYLTLLLERGALGFTLFMWLIIKFLATGSRIYRSAAETGTQLVRAISLGLTGSMIVFLIHSAVDHFYGGFTFKVLFFLYIALIISLENFLETQKSETIKRAQS